MSRGARQRGGAAVEFALVFPILFMLIYGVIVYSYVFIVHESINFAAQAAAEAAVAVKADHVATSAYGASVQTYARAMAVKVLDWLPDAQKQSALGSNGDKVAVTIQPATTGSGAVYTVTVLITLPLKSPAVFPIIDLPVIGEVPKLPDSIIGKAVVQV